LPYLIWLTLKNSGLELGQSGGYAGEPQKAIFSLFHMLDYVDALSLRGLAQEIVFITAMVLPLSALVLAIAIATGKFFDKRTNQFFTKEMAPWLICAIAAFVPFSYWIFVDIGKRYSTPFFLTLLALTVLSFERSSSPRVLSRYVWCASSLLMVLLAASFTLPTKHTSVVLQLAFAVIAPLLAVWFFDTKFRQRGAMAMVALGLTIAVAVAQRAVIENKPPTVNSRLMPILSEWKNIWGSIYLATGWSYDEAIGKIFFVNHHIEQDARPAYDFVVSHAGPTNLMNPKPDGFFVSFKYRADDGDFLDPASWLLEQNIPSEIKKALENRDLKLGLPLAKNMFLIPYYVKSTALLPKNFHDSAEGYLRGQHDLVLDRLPASEGTAELKPGQYLFKWNECPSAHQFCSTGAVVDLQSEQHNYHMKVKIVGSALSEVSPWVSPGWTQNWIEPYAQVRCGKEVQRFPLATSIGYDRRYATDPARLLLWGNNSFVAPFEREFEFKCSEKISEISVGRNSSQVETIYDLKILPAKELSLKL
jgi:hypothetical protein